LAIDVKIKSDLITHVVIQEEMTIYTVLEQKSKLIPCLKADAELQLDLSEVVEIDSAGMQLLVYMKQEAIRLNNRFSLYHHSQAVVEVVDLLNLTSVFGDSIVLPVGWGE